MGQIQRFVTLTLAGAGLWALAGSASAQSAYQFANGQIPSGNPFNNSATENVDFGDVDLDGDFDAIFSDGGDNGNDQSRIWTNNGGIQSGTVGFFTDVTAAQFPSIQSDGRDIEFADFDQDGDLDIYLSNTAQITVTNNSNRWWTNQGGLQGGTLGFYVDETAARWSGLGGPGSSIAASQLGGNGGFIDFSCDCDFGDLDNDGDLDLVHSSYGGAFGGQVPTRLFRNNGSGVFTEFNPSGFQLGGQTIANGNPGLWCEGTQAANTTNSTGANCDIASSALDIDVGDCDGDLDLDILHGARQEAPRMFDNRLTDTGGTLAFRDVTGAVFPAGYSTGNGHYEQEMGDLDNDNDLDIYGLNWLVAGASFTDITLRNAGVNSGTYDSLTTLLGSTSDDNEGDFGDYDGDGDLDLFVANFSGQERLYRNNFSGGNFSYTLTTGAIPADGSTSLDADFGDVDNDADYDIMVANDGGQANTLLKNIVNVADAIAPRLPVLEQAPDRAASAVPTVVRCYVYDNASYYTTWYNPTTCEYQVNGGSFTSVAARSSQGQIFRAEIPGALVGTVGYRFRSEDRYGNAATSSLKTYNATGGGCTGNVTTYCTPKVSSNFCTPTISGTGTPSLGAPASFVINSVSLEDGKNGLTFFSTTGANGAPFQGGFLCAKSPLYRLGVKNTGGAGICQGSLSYTLSNMLAHPSGGPLLVATQQVNSQTWFRDPGSPSTTGLSNGLQFVICP